MVVLNSNYWFTPSVAASPESGGNLHGYLMDQQIAWLEKTLGEIERNKTIDHVFLTVHTPLFPNGGHVGDAMWYGGNNTPRATVAGKPVAKGIIERRDDLLALIQKHPKVLAVLTGDEHNYNRTRLDATRADLPAGVGQAEGGAEAAVLPDQQRGRRRAVLRAGRHAVVGGGERVLDPARRLPPHRRGPEGADSRP